MKAKLIKTEVNYILEDDKGVVIASTSLNKEGLSLSIKNCQVIDELPAALSADNRKLAEKDGFDHVSPAKFDDSQKGEDKFGVDAHAKLAVSNYALTAPAGIILKLIVLLTTVQTPMQVM